MQPKMTSLFRWSAALAVTAAILALGLSRGAVRPKGEIAAAASGESDAGPRLEGTERWAVLSSGLSILLGLLLYRAPARAVRETRRGLQEAFRRQALELREEDRRRIARELHDGAGQALTAARLQLTALRDSGADGKVVDRIARCIDDAIDEVRRSTTALAPPSVAEMGLGPALQRHCSTAGMGSSLQVECRVPNPLPLLDDHVEIACYRIAQEGLHNVVRHARATKAWVQLEATDIELRLEIGDDGAGLPEGSGDGFGLGSIRERARLMGGVAKRVPGAGPGARVRVTVPLEGGPG